MITLWSEPEISVRAFRKARNTLFVYLKSFPRYEEFPFLQCLALVNETTWNQLVLLSITGRWKFRLQGLSTFLGPWLLFPQ